MKRELEGERLRRAEHFGVEVDRLKAAGVIAIRTNNPSAWRRYHDL